MRLQLCAWCGSPLLYMAQDRLPSVRSYCDDRCARTAWLATRARMRMDSLKALDIAIQKLRRSAKPTEYAAAVVLTTLRLDMVDQHQHEQAERVAAFRARLPHAA
jgi:hypothetical protein